MSSHLDIFDRRLLRQRRERITKNIEDFDFLFQEVAVRLLERLDLIKQELPLIVDMGSAHGFLSGKLKARSGTETVISMDSSFQMLKDLSGLSIVADEEFLPFQERSLDAVVSNLTLQWVNDLPGTLIQIKKSLKPERFFLASLLGGETLKELRGCLMEAEISVTGGASPRISPFIDPYDMSALMQRASFDIPTVDVDTIVVDYADAFKLMHDLRGMGAANAVLNRLKKPTQKQVMLEAARLYHEKFSNAEGRIPATFQVVYIIGWSPA